MGIKSFMTCDLSINYAISPIFMATALLTIGVSSLHNSVNFYLIFSLELPALGYSGLIKLTAETRHVKFESLLANLKSIGII